MMRWWMLLSIVLYFAARVGAAESVALDSGEEITFERFVGGDRARLLVFPADEGFVENERRFAQALAAQGFDVVYPHLHDSYFLTPGAYSLAAIPLEELVTLVADIDRQGPPLYVVANQRVALLALEVMYAYQRRASARIPGGLILLSPYLEDTAPGPAEAIRYHPAARRSNLPIYVFQPRSSSRVFYLEQTVEALSEGGSAVFTNVEPNTRDAYHIWPDEITDYEQQQRSDLPQRIAKAVALLSGMKPAALPPPVDNTEPAGRASRVFALPQPLEDMPAAPGLAATDLDGRAWSAGELQGRVVLLNFWATWCPPCVEELPSLQRLHEGLTHPDFDVISVDVAEDHATVSQFLERNRMQLGYPVLLDPAGDTVQQWRLTGFPTSFLIDRQGRLRYGLIGAIEWDGDEVVELIESLLAEPR